ESAETGLNDRLILILPPLTNAAGATSPASAIPEFYLPRLGPHSPSRDHDLLARVEVDPVAALQMEIAVERAFPSTERIEGQRLRDPDIDSDHSAFDLFAELARGPARSGEDRRHVTQRDPIDQLDRLPNVRHVRYRQDRPEDFLPPRRHRRRYPVQNRRPQKKARMLQVSARAAVEHH